MKGVIILIAILLVAASCENKKHADYIIQADGIYTGIDSVAVHNAVAVVSGKIIAVDKYENIAKEYETDSMINIAGYIYPGFIDAHCHFSGYALDGYKCDLIGTKSFNEILDKLKSYEQTNTYGWIYGRGWDQNDWEVKEYPNNIALDKLFPNKPVVLKRIDGHAVLCNSKALQLAGININTKINGGLIEQKDGKLTGILIDNATEPVERILGKLPDEDAVKYLQKAEHECYKYGLTTVVDCGVKKQEIELLIRLYKEGKLTIGNALLLSQDNETLEAFAERGKYYQGQLAITGIKMYADGSLGSRGACLIEPYTDMPKHYGLMLADKDEMNRIAMLAKANDLQLCTHAIGDSANRAILRLYSQILPKNNTKRWRIEHAQVVKYNDYMYYSDYSIIPSVQPTHAISDMPWAEKRIGKERLPTAYAFRNLLDAAGTIALGTDFPVEAINPLATFYTAVARKDKDGNPQNGYMKENALTRFEALRGMTIWAAHSVFIE
ncbi:hypothetical protein CAP35_04510 [Chitinophagaceae bacterium IBVUCB1]|nr:hypothetical protein CAP35_04510 [Chitinophagaceae bacterium IBVUCB1]